ncbi:YrhB domain-containing protein [Bradyrhizobium sp. WSM3983]|uniref:YrhB domain-containing protein n=1 Tax=Bradyrhizobium sp. WSM3983 TaxID=1038867 RepID=UPI0009FC63D6|nr:YrhB domain-containing protein [Bradyrhizobium sp. WSM3983]
MSPDQAMALAEAEVMKVGIACGNDLALVSEQTLEVTEGWVLFYNTREYIETGNSGSRLAGNGPILVDRAGCVHHLPTLLPGKTRLRDFESPRSRPRELLAKQGSLELLLR